MQQVSSFFPAKTERKNILKTFFNFIHWWQPTKLTSDWGWRGGMEWSYDIWLYNICVAWLKFVWFRLLDCCLSVRLFACLDDYLPGWLGASSFACPSVHSSVCRLWFMSCSHAVAAKGFVVFNMFLSARKCLLHLLCLQQHLRQAWDVARSGSEFLSVEIRPQHKGNPI